MKLVSKKNGTTTIFSSLISAVARKIGFTPPTGMSANNVQDAIEEVNGKASKYIIEKVSATLSPSVVVGQNVYTYFIIDVTKSGYKAIGAVNLSCGDSHIMFGNFGASSNNEIGVDIWNPSSNTVTITNVTATVVYERL